jgi:hypothetical protein
MLAKRPNLSEAEAAELLDLRNTISTDSVPESQQAVVVELGARAVNNVIAVDFAPVEKPPARAPWPDYEEFFPTDTVEATEPITQLTPELVNRRCYWRSYWPKTTVFRIKEVDSENNTIYLNLVYRWVSANEIQLLKVPTPQRPPKDIELACGDMPF